MKTILAKKAVYMFVSGTMGAGKTACVTKFVSDYFLPQNSGCIITNVSLIPNKIAARACRLDKSLNREEVEKRIIVIPREWNERLLDGEIGMQDFIDHLVSEQCAERGISTDPEDWPDAGYEHPLNRGLIVMDEAQKYWPSGHGDGKGQNQNMLEFISTIRHRGARVLMISQDFANVANKIRKLVAARIHIRNCVHWNFPLIGLPMDVVLQMWAKFTGTYSPWVTIDEFSGNPENGEELEVSGKHWMPSEIFDCYQSRDNVDGLVGEEEKLEFERFSTLRFWKWVFFTHWFAWSRVLICVTLFLVLIYPGGYLTKIFFGVWNGVSQRLTSTFDRREKKSDAPDVYVPSPEPEDDIQPVDDPAPVSRSREDLFIKIIDTKGVVFSNGARVKIGGEFESLGVLKDVDLLYGEANFGNRTMRLRSSWLSGGTDGAGKVDRVPGRIPNTSRPTAKREGSKNR